MPRVVVIGVPVAGGGVAVGEVRDGGVAGEVVMRQSLPENGSHAMANMSRSAPWYAMLCG
jgi:hypothetical protein